MHEQTETEVGLKKKKAGSNLDEDCQACVRDREFASTLYPVSGEGALYFAFFPRLLVDVGVVGIVRFVVLDVTQWPLQPGRYALLVNTD
jgi:hypothetical protein